ncbi:MAG: non-canonical purine NTP diphosphatase [Bacteroidota bacterium]
MKLVFATHNDHKLQEVRHMLPRNMNILGLKEIGCTEEIPETQPTLEGNALDKARFVKSNYCYNCFSDDTGLEIDALEGRPGVYSARYAGNQKDSGANMRKVLEELRGVTHRKARFRTVIALIINNEELLFEGIAEGEIIEKPRGEEGFGYDPIFVPAGYDQTFAEMSHELKNRISHRYKAFNMLAEYMMAQNYF